MKLKRGAGGLLISHGGFLTIRDKTYTMRQEQIQDGNEYKMPLFHVVQRSAHLKKKPEWLTINRMEGGFHVTNNTQLIM